MGGVWVCVYVCVGVCVCVGQKHVLDSVWNKNKNKHMPHLRFYAKINL